MEDYHNAVVVDGVVVETFEKVEEGEEEEDKQSLAPYLNSRHDE